MAGGFATNVPPASTGFGGPGMGASNMNVPSNVQFAGPGPSI